ncbi:MAG TPA: ABC transporter substrate-binding protein [Solirubrobacteraceae bacterium]|nr:ABC transporter substrate-binding protein [Solirubrobacteraceae bacterium]
MRGAGLGLGALYVAGCGGTSQKLPSSSSQTSAALGSVTVAPGIPGPPAGGGRRGGSIVVAWEAAGNSFDPALGYDLPSWDSICNCTTAPPMVFGADGQGPFPNAAASLTPNHDHSVWTIRFRDGVTFQNGRPVKAEDYVYSWLRVLDPKLASWASSYLDPIDGAAEVTAGKARTIRGIRQLDPMTLRIQLTGPDITFPNILAEPYMAAVAREAVERWGAAFARHVVSTGPFTLSSYDAVGQTATFSRNRNYFWTGLPYLDAVIYRWGSDAQTELLQLQKGDIDSIGPGIGPTLLPQVSAEPALARYVVKVPELAVRWIGFNLHQPPFHDPRVRQALNWAADREQISRISYGAGVPWGLPFPDGLPDYTRIAPQYTYAPERARSLLSAAGADRLSFTLTTSSDDPYPSIAQVLQQQLQAVGVDMSIDTVSDNAYNIATEKKNFAAAVVDWYQVQPTALDILDSNYVTGGSANYWNYSNPKVDALAARALAAANATQSNEYLARAEQLIAQDAPGLFLASLDFVDGRNPALENFHYNIFYGTYYDRLWKRA